MNSTNYFNHKHSINFICFELRDKVLSGIITPTVCSVLILSKDVAFFKKYMYTFLSYSKN